MSDRMRACLGEAWEEYGVRDPDACVRENEPHVDHLPREVFWRALEIACAQADNVAESMRERAARCAELHHHISASDGPEETDPLDGKARYSNATVKIVAAQIRALPLEDD